MTRSALPSLPAIAVAALAATLFSSIALVPTSHADDDDDFVSAWTTLEKTRPGALETVDEGERRLLRLMSYEQLVAWTDGLSAEHVELPGGVPLTRVLGGGPDYEMTSWSIDGGGGDASAGDYSLTGSVAQHDAGWLAGGSFALAGGFLGRQPTAIFADGFESGNTSEWDG